MKTFCVPSHHSITPYADIRQGVRLTTEMLEKGIWYPVAGSSEEHPNSYKKSIELVRSENQPEYLAALRALIHLRSGIKNPDDFDLFAVISMRWCSLTYRLVTTKRVWLGFYREQRELHTFSHRRDRSPTYNFCDCWDKPELDQEAWKQRFNEKLTSGR